jgi:hypothetical protein
MMPVMISKEAGLPTASALWLAVVLLVGTSGAAEEPAGSPPPPRTPWGAPDLMGVWTTATATPLERPEAMSGKERLSEAEAAALEESIDRQYESFDAKPRPGTVGGYNRGWLDPGLRVVPDRRTALIVDPPDGRIPWRPEWRDYSKRERARYGVGPYDSHLDLDTGERCISDGVTMAPLQPYNMNFQILQTPDWLAIVHEMYNEVRLVPLDGRPHIDSRIGQWLGDARARWQGDTLVVETTRFADKSRYHWAWPWRSARPSLRVTERFTRVDSDTIDYRFTIEDPVMFTRPWTASAPMTTDQASRGVTAGPLYEYACHEGNHALPNVLRGARATERDDLPPGPPGS